jgi:hypothetical protein
MNPARNRPRASEAEPTRAANDLYPTPQPLCDAICRKLRETIGEVERVIEPSCGPGNFVRAAYATWPRASQAFGDVNAEAVASIHFGETWPEHAHLPGWRWENPRWDAELRLDPRWGGTGTRLILGNPPFDRAESHVRIALDRLGHFTATAPQLRWLAFVLRASFLAGQRRTAGLWTEAPARYVWHLAPRPSFTADGKTDGAEYVLCVWQAGHRGSYEGGWLNWRGT